MTEKLEAQGEEGQAQVAKPSWELRLYIAGSNPRSETALLKLRELCEKHLKGQYVIEVIDLLLYPHLAREDQIVAVPTLIRKLPPPLRKIVGDMSDETQTLVGLQLRPVETPEK